MKSRSLLLAAALAAAAAVPAGAEPLLVGFAHTDITPEVTSERAVWLAGYGQGRRATGVHDPLFARAVVLRSGNQSLAMVSVDLVGLQYPVVQAVRARLEEIDYVVVSSTHNHEGPDVIGIWGRTLLHSGADPLYLKLVEDQVVAAVQAADKSRREVVAHFGTAEDETLLGDSRRPFVFDGVLRVLRFAAVDNGETAGLLVQWNCHPESLGSKNTLVTADFPFAVIAALEKRYRCPVAYFTGAVGGLMAPPDHVVKDDRGVELKEGDFEYARVYGEMTAALAEKAVNAASPISLAPFVVSARPIALAVDNLYYRTGQALGVLQRPGRIWTGDFEKLGEPIASRPVDPQAAADPAAGPPLAVETEVAYLRMGELHVACIPGEIYPELVYGKFQEPVDPGADFPEAPLEPTVAGLMPGERWMLLGLANDEIGYIIPRRQWDEKPPFAYGRSKSQYGEINSCGPQTAPILMEALQRRVREAAGK